MNSKPFQVSTIRNPIALGTLIRAQVLYHEEDAEHIQMNQLTVSLHSSPLNLGRNGVRPAYSVILGVGFACFNNNNNLFIPCPL